MSTRFTTDYELPRNPWFTDDEGVRSTSKRTDEIVPCVIDWSDALYGSETISSVAYEDSGVTRSSVSNTTTTTTCDVTGIGSFEVTATLSTGRKLQRIRRFYEQDAANTTDDYQG